ncbi:MAG: transketolase [Deltaproteobacteria bacterium]|nr:transketolase [Deltaproteobacteria bacterium]
MDAMTQLAINTIRLLSVDGVQKANSGHPGLPMGAAPMTYVLWQKHLRHNPKSPKWPDRDRFVLSAGHGSMLLYSMLHLYGYDLALDELKAFRQWGSRAPGHPESFCTPGVEATTGPLGQGAANAVGMAMAERFLAGHYNRPGLTIVDHMTYALVGDGDLMEGITHEAASLAGHLGLGKLVWLYDDNRISLDGPTTLAFTEDVARRFEAYHWHVLKVEQGDTDVEGIDRAIAAAKTDPRPSLIMVRSTIGFGSPRKAGTSEAHGSPLGPDEVKATKSALGWDPEKQFHVPEEARAHFREAAERGARLEAEWQAIFETWAKAHPDLASEWRIALRNELPADWESAIPTFSTKDELASRVSGGKVLAAIAGKVPWLIGGDADLSCSTMTSLPGLGDFDGKTGLGRNIHFGVREHAMGAIANGMAYHGQVRAFTATFFVFSDYERPAIRMAALSKLPVTFVFTHDSIGVGEDGPTHQPVEHLAALRCIPNLWVIRPADASEVAQAYRAAMRRNEGPVAIVLTRQKLPTFDRSKVAAAAGLSRGAYVLSEAPGGPPQVLLLATGSEVSLALAAQEKLLATGIRARVVSMPCWELFAEQPAEYRESVIPPAVTARVSVEAGTTLGWHRFTGASGVTLGLDRFGASGPGAVLVKQFGFTADNIVRAATSLVKP